ncbi:peptidase M10A, Metallopeptidase, catalytic domain protein [Artemisia annua]|uniref:Peptidase M10A, Metallopeptidase, catalytic domain protein n=1 Tax=Artemisia annua TaxID=35608 RepID=A0A2U1NG35_ARTAN|nr:peptidase M10A, Metallopeptidase, catalytic domain protein [Artemisia annua]
MLSGSSKNMFWKGNRHGKDVNRFRKSIGLGFKTPRETIEEPSSGTGPRIDERMNMASLCINVLEGVSNGQILKAESSVGFANLTSGTMGQIGGSGGIFKVWWIRGKLNSGVSSGGQIVVQMVSVLIVINHGIGNNTAQERSANPVTILYAKQLNSTLDVDETWSVATGPVANTIDLQTVALNKIGHLLGLGHSEDENAIMWGSIPSGSLNGLNSVDILGVKALYGLK